MKRFTKYIVFALIESSPVQICTVKVEALIVRCIYRIGDLTDWIVTKGIDSAA